MKNYHSAKDSAFNSGGLSECMIMTLEKLFEKTTNDKSFTKSINNIKRSPLLRDGIIPNSKRGLK
jgi:hypothetical protein